MRNRKRIRMLSRGCRFISSWIIFFILTAVVLLLLMLIHTLAFSAMTEEPADTPMVVCLMFFFLCGGVVSLYGLFKLRGLLKLYEKEVFYSERNVSFFKGMGWALIVLNVIGQIAWLSLPLMPDSFGALDIRSQNEVGFLLDLPSSFDFLFAGIVLLVISWAVDEGRKLKEEQEQFI